MLWSWTWGCQDQWSVTNEPLGQWSMAMISGQSDQWYWSIDYTDQGLINNQDAQDS